ncbi:MAG: hydroxymyristoyl-ACP dehydratase, partial [Betaproteobacteria bacterium]
SVREVVLHTSRLDDVVADLEIEALWHAGDGNNVVYRFSVRADHRELLCGRVAVVLDIDRMARDRAEGKA